MQKNFKIFCTNSTLKSLEKGYKINFSQNNIVFGRKRWTIFTGFKCIYQKKMPYLTKIKANAVVQLNL